MVPKQTASELNITIPPDREFFKDTGIRNDLILLLDISLGSVKNRTPVPVKELTTSAESHQERAMPTESSPSLEDAEYWESEVPTESSPSFEGAEYWDSQVPTESLPSFEGAEYWESEVPTESSPSFEGAEYWESQVPTESSPSFECAKSLQEAEVPTESLPSLEGAVMLSKMGTEHILEFAYRMIVSLNKMCRK